MSHHDMSATIKRKKARPDFYRQTALHNRPSYHVIKMTREEIDVFYAFFAGGLCVVEKR